MFLIGCFRKYRRFFLLLVGLTAFFLYILIFNVDILQLAAIIEQISIEFFVLALLVGLLEVLFFTLSWKVLLTFLQINLDLKKLLLFVRYGFYMDIIVPAEAITGDIARVYLIEKDNAKNKGKNGIKIKAAASVLAQRLLGMVLNVMTLLLGVVLVVVGAQLNDMFVYFVIFVAIIITSVIGLVIVLLVKESLSIKIVTVLLSFVDRVSKNRWNAARWEKQIDDFMGELRSSMINYKDRPRVLTISMAYLVLNWTCSFSIPYIIFLSLNYPVPLSTVIITASIIAAIKSVPIGVPFEVGLPEITMTTLFIALGVPANIGATATILTRMVTLWFKFGLGFAAQQWLELKPKV